MCSPVCLQMGFQGKVHRPHQGAKRATGQSRELDVHTPASPAPKRLSEEDASSGPASQWNPVSALLSQIKQDKKNP